MASDSSTVTFDYAVARPAEFDPGRRPLIVAVRLAGWMYCTVGAARLVIDLSRPGFFKRLAINFASDTFFRVLPQCVVAVCLLMTRGRRSPATDLFLERLFTAAFLIVVAITVARYFEVALFGWPDVLEHWPAAIGSRLISVPPNHAYLCLIPLLLACPAAVVRRRLFIFCTLLAALAAMDSPLVSRLLFPMLYSGPPKDFARVVRMLYGGWVTLQQSPELWYLAGACALLACPRRIARGSIRVAFVLMAIGVAVVLKTHVTLVTTRSPTWRETEALDTALAALDVLPLLVPFGLLCWVTRHRTIARGDELTPAASLTRIHDSNVLMK